MIEKAINEKRIEAHFLEYLRGLIHTYSWFIITLAGLHLLEEMSRDYWNPLFLSVEPILVSFLSDKATLKLITEPEPNFPLEYDKAALTEILKVTYNQPYLVQRICKTLVKNFNEQTFEAAIQREKKITRSDVQTVIESKAFFRDAHAYFSGVWEQAAEVDEVQPEILKTLAPAPDGLTRSELAAQTVFSNNELDDALKVLENHDVLKKQGDRITYTVELMQRWVRNKLQG